MSHIFVSYAHDDNAFVNRLSADLLDYGYLVWVDTLNLRGGQAWEDEINAAIDACTHLLLVWTANTEPSGYVNKEINRAQRQGKVIIPLLVSGDPARMRQDMQALQWIDFQDNYHSGWEHLLEAIPLPENTQAPPKLENIIKRGDMTFRAAEKLWRSTISFGAGDADAVGLLLDRSEHGIQSYLVGRRSSYITAPDHIQVFLHFTGGVNFDPFGEFLDYVTENDLPLWTVLVRGPLRPDEKWGLSYQLPVVKSSQDRTAWHTAIQMTWAAILRVGETHKPLKLFMMAPVAMATAFGAIEHFKRSLDIYQQDRSGSAKFRYYKAYQYKF